MRNFEDTSLSDRSHTHKRHSLPMASLLGAPFRALFRATLPLTLQPKDELCGVADLLSAEDLRGKFSNRPCLVVGGTKGIGKAIADVLRSAGAKVEVVGRSADNTCGTSADLSTVAGCKALLGALERKGCAKFAYVIFTLGVWPDPTSPYTSDGVDKVVALDLLARHVVLTGLVDRHLLTDTCRVLNVLASCQTLPGVGDAEAVKATLRASVLGGDERDRARGRGESGGSPPTPLLRKGLRECGTTLMTAAVAHDAWLRHIAAARLPAGVHVASTFPGLLVTELPRSTLPGFLVPTFQLAMAPVADSYEQMGRSHASILASDGFLKRKASFWAAPLLEAHMAHPLAYGGDGTGAQQADAKNGDPGGLGAWVTAFLDELASSM